MLGCREFSFSAVWATASLELLALCVGSEVVMGIVHYRNYFFCVDSVVIVLYRWCPLLLSNLAVLDGYQLFRQILAKIENCRNSASSAGIFACLTRMRARNRIGMAKNAKKLQVCICDKELTI